MQLRQQGPQGGPPVLTLDAIRFGGQIYKDSLGKRYYDTTRYKAGTAIAVGTRRFFSIAEGGSTDGGNFATTFNKTRIDTNMQQQSQLPKGQLFKVETIQVRVILTGATDTTYGASGSATEMPTNAAAAALISAPNEEKVILESASLVFHVGEKDYEDGKLIHFPTRYGISGFAGGGQPGAGGIDNVAIANNGFGRPWRLPVERWIEGLRTFFVDVTFQYSFTPNRNFNLEITLEGILWRSVQ